MAIQKATLIPSQNGGMAAVSGNFWVGRNFYVSPDYSGVEATMALYRSQADYLAGAPAIFENTFELAGNKNPVGKGVLAALIEEQLIAVVPTFVSGVHI